MSTVDERTGGSAAEEAAPSPAERDAQLSTQPAPDAARRVTGHGLLAQLRRWWRQLTSMRTALILLFLLAVASVPGTMLPQRGLNPLKVEDYFAAHPELAPFLDRLSAFDVFGAPWFAAIYLLLFVSLVGCLVPRLRLHARALWRRPPAAPRHLDRLPVHRALVPVAASPADAALAIRSVLRKRRWRSTIRTAEDGTVTVSAEKGYLRETGNLVFHVALMAVLAGVAGGGLWGWKASVLAVEGGDFCDTVQAYDQFNPGRLVGDASLPPFCVTLDDFRARYLASGQPSDFAADVRYVEGPAAEDADPSSRRTIRVNDPLRMDGANIYLINHGYAPILKYKDRHGTVFTTTTPFLPQDTLLTSEGVVVLPDANQDPKSGTTVPGVQVAFEGIYMPTVPDTGLKIRSAYPAERRPGLTLLAYRGDTGLNSGIPHSVYSLDQGQVRSGALKPVGTMLLRRGQTWKLDDGSELTFVGTREWASFQVGHDPGQLTVLGGAIAMVLGLIASLMVRRRRVWFRLSGVDAGPGVVGRTVVSVGGLGRTDSETFAEEFRRTVDAVALAVPAAGAAGDRAGTAGDPPAPTAVKD
jgi:cytochrome c biogenesis protein